MSADKATHADHPVLPRPDQPAVVSTKPRDTRSSLEAPLIGLAMYLISVSLGFDTNFGSGVLVTTSFISAAKSVTSGTNKRESIAGSASMGLFAQLVCYHFEMKPIMHVGNALNTCFSMYLATKKSSTGAESSVEESRTNDDDSASEHTAGQPRSGEGKGTIIWFIFAGLSLIASVANYLSSDQLPLSNCIVSTHKIDNIHWQAIVYGGDSSGSGCDVPTQMALVEREMRVYTRSLKADSCSVSCIKQNYTGYWTAFVSVTPPGSPVDGTYCGEAYSFGNCGQGLARQKIG